MRSTHCSPGAAGVAAACALVLCAQRPAAGSQPPADPPQLQPTVHAAVPENVDDYWFAPRPADAAAARNTALSAAAVATAAGHSATPLASAPPAVARAAALQPYPSL